MYPLELRSCSDQFVLKCNNIIVCIKSQYLVPVDGCSPAGGTEFRGGILCSHNFIGRFFQAYFVLVFHLKCSYKHTKFNRGHSI